MRVLRIDRDLTVTEIDQPMEDWMGDKDWDSARIDSAHEAWVEDDGLFQPGVVCVTLGEGKNIPLPAYVAGFAGERSVDATITVDQLRAMIT